MDTADTSVRPSFAHHLDYGLLSAAIILLIFWSTLTLEQRFYEESRVGPPDPAAGSPSGKPAEPFVATAPGEAAPRIIGY
jgi:hypothetical protein